LGNIGSHRQMRKPTHLTHKRHRSCIAAAQIIPICSVVEEQCLSVTTTSGLLFDHFAGK
jgi:hypothetical protein